MSVLLIARRDLAAYLHSYFGFIIIAAILCVLYVSVGIL